MRTGQRPALRLRRLASLVALAALVATALASHFRRGVGAAFASASTVLVTGAGGRTGRLVVRKLLEGDGYGVRALVRSEKSKQELMRATSLMPHQVFVGDILDPDSMKKAMAGCTALIIATSAVPRIRFFSLVKAILGKLVGKKLRPKFTWKGDLKPEQVDWEGQKNQVDLAIEANIPRIILVGSMGGTQPDNFLNSIGEGAGDKILVWKRKAETYLIEKCKAAAKCSYTIVHPGGLIDKPGAERAIALGVDDALLERKSRSIPREDVAEVCVQAIRCKEAENRSFDICTDPPVKGEAQVPGALMPGTGQLAELLKSQLEGKNCDYTIQPPP